MALNGIDSNLSSAKEKSGFMFGVFFGYRDPSDPVIKYDALSPLSAFVSVWRIMTAAVLFYIALFMPIRVAFEADLPCDDNLVICDLIIDLFFIMDIILAFFTGYRKKNKLVMQRARIASHYLRTWFAFDCLVSLPVTWGIFVWNDGHLCSENTNSLVLAPKLLRFGRLLRAALRALKLFRLGIFDFIHINYFAKQLMKLVLGIFFFSHILACGWWYLKDSDSQAKADFLIEHNMTAASIGDKYTSALYFVAATITTVGYGDIRATTNAERAFCVVLLMVGAGVFAIIMASIGGLVQTSTAPAIKMSTKMTSVKEFFKYHNVQEPLEARILDFIEHNSDSDNYKMNFRLLEDLPPGLHRELALALSETLLGDISLFWGVSPEFLGALLMRVNSYRVSVGETVFEEGEDGTAGYLVGTGFIETTNSFGDFEKKADGSMFGELALIGLPRDTSAVAIDLSTLFILDKVHFEAACRVDPDSGFHVVAELQNAAEKTVFNEDLLAENSNFGLEKQQFNLPQLDKMHPRASFQFMLQISCRHLRKMDAFGLSDPYYTLKYTPLHGEPVLVHKSEIILSSLNPNFEPVLMDDWMLCEGRMSDKCIRLDVLDYDEYGGDDKIGHVEVSLDDLIHLGKAGRTQPLIYPRSTFNLRRHHPFCGSVFIKRIQCFTRDGPSPPTPKSAAQLKAMELSKRRAAQGAATGIALMRRGSTPKRRRGSVVRPIINIPTGTVSPPFSGGMLSPQDDGNAWGPSSRTGAITPGWPQDDVSSTDVRSTDELPERLSELSEVMLHRLYQTKTAGLDDASKHLNQAIVIAHKIVSLTHEPIEHHLGENDSDKARVRFQGDTEDHRLSLDINDPLPVDDDQHRPPLNAIPPLNRNTSLMRLATPSKAQTIRPHEAMPHLPDPSPRNVSNVANTAQPPALTQRITVELGRLDDGVSAATFHQTFTTGMSPDELERQTVIKL